MVLYCDSWMLADVRCRMLVAEGFVFVDNIGMKASLKPCWR